MALLVLMFVVLLSVTFGLVLAMTRQSTEEKAMDLRIGMIRAATAENPHSLNVAAVLSLKAAGGQFGWLGRYLRKYQMVQMLQLRILQANSSKTLGSLFLMSLGLALLGFAISWLFIPILLVDTGCGLFLGALPYWVLSFKRSKRIASFNAVLADTIDMLARALRAGYSMAGAIGMVAENAQEPAASEFGEIFKQQNLGMPLRDALLQLLDRFPSLDLRVLVTAILVQKDTGGNLAEILDRTVFVIRDRLRIQGEIRVQTAQGRMTGWILSALPIVMLIFINLINPGYSNVLLTDPTGRKLIYIGVGMLAVGAFIISRIVNGIEV